MRTCVRETATVRIDCLISLTAGSSSAAHPAVEVDRHTIGIDLRLPFAMRRVAVDHAPGAGAAEPCFEAQPLTAEDASGGHRADQRVGVTGLQEPAYLAVDGPDRVRIARKDESAQLVAVTVLDQ